MKTRGRIGMDEKSFTIQRNLSFTEAQKKDVAMYEPKMIIQFHQNVKGGFKAGQKYEVVSKDDDGRIFVSADKDAKPLSLPMRPAERYQVFKQDEIKLSHGDLIRITNNGRTQEHTRIHNGQVFKVKGFTSEGHIRLSNGKTLDKTYANFSYGVVNTSHGVQGKDAHTVLIAQSAMSFAATNSKQLYVSASRAKENIKIYTDDKDALREAVSKSGDRMSARDIADRQKGEKRMHIKTRNRRHYLNTIIKPFTKDDRSRQSTKEQILKPDRAKPRAFSKE